MASVLPRVVATLLVALTATVTHAQVPEPLRSIIAFDKATQDYVLMHRRLERQVGSIELTTSADEINRKIQQLAAAIRAERPAARQGDLFAPSLSRLLRARIQETLAEHRYSVDDARASSRVDGVDYTRVKLQVNETFPWVLGAAMLPCLIEMLPPLPPELQYRMVDDVLVLIDIHASLIVDILPYALADLTVRNIPPQGDFR
jgi:hypothetical protein